jgi:hypothetical protein
LTISPEILGDWQRVKREKKRRLIQERLRTFKPTEPPYNDQRGFLESRADVQFVLGGNRSGKTESGAVKALHYCLRDTGPTHGRVVAPKYEDGCKGVVLKKYRTLIPHYQLKGTSWVRAWSEREKTLHLDNGSTINFKSSEMDLNTFGGADLDWVHEDEHIPEKYFLENRARLTDRNGFTMKTMTPEAGQTWEEDFINNPPKGISVDVFNFSTDKNPYLSVEGVNALKATIRDPRLYAAKLHGQFVALGGLVIPQYRSNKCLVRDFPLEPHWPKTVIIDPHLKKPTAIMWICWIEDEVCVVYRTRKVKMPVGELAQYIKAQTAPDGKISLWIADEAQGGKGTNVFGQESVIAQLNELGLPFMPTNQSSDKTFEAGINKLQSMFTPDAITDKPGILIFESNMWEPQWIDGKTYGNIDWELKRYQYKREQKADEETFRERVRTVDDDLIDDLRYGVMAGSSMSGGRIEVINSSGRDVDPFTGW